MDLKGLQSCIKEFELQASAKDDGKDLQARVQQKFLQYRTKNEHVDHTMEKNLQARHEERHLSDRTKESELQTDIEDKEIQARIKEKWATRHGSASSLTLRSGDYNPENRFHPASNTHGASQDNTASGGGDVKPKERFPPLPSNANTIQSSLLNHLAWETRAQTPPRQMPLNTSDGSQRWQCRPKRVSPKPVPSSKATPKMLGDFECEEFVEGEESSNGKWLNCKKNPGHREFIPVNEFTLQHLPQGYRKKIFFKGIKSVAKVTVRLRVKYNSKDRPEGYLFANLGGTRLSHTGSGFVYTRFFSDDMKSKEVPKNLTHEGKEDKGLEDHLAAKHNRNKGEDRFSMLMERVCQARGKDVNWLKRAFKPSVKTARVLKGLVSLVADHQDDWKSRLRRDDDSDSDDPVYEDDIDDDRKKVWDSHEGPCLFGVNPLEDLAGAYADFIDAGKKNRGHGENSLGTILGECISPDSKWEEDYRQLSRMKKRENILKKVSSFVGVVFPGGGDDEEDDTSESDDDDDDIKYSDTDSDEDFGEGDKLKNDQKNTDAEDDTDDGDNEIDDVDFIDELDDYKLKELQRQHQADLNETFGLTHPCCCPECKNSSNPKPKGYYVNVLTARHVVFDTEEAQNTEVVLFCDDESESGVATLYGVDVHLYSHDGDMVILMCATHDIKLIWKLRLLVVNMMKKVEKMKQKSDTPLAVICSHPHGNFKHVTIGEWTYRDIHRRRDGQPPLWTTYRYKTASCSGSSGAPVIILGHKEGTLLLDSMIHPHHGSHDDELNKSSRHISLDTDMKKVDPHMRKRLMKEQRQVRRKIREETARRHKEEGKMWRNIANKLDRPY